MTKRFQILSLDGGGIKGIFSAAVLAFLEEDLKVNITDHFDLIVGTSTGGIIALGLGIGIRPNEILNFYLDKGPQIFSSNLYFKVRQLFRSKFDAIKLEKALKECFGVVVLGKSKKRLVIPSYNLGEDYIYIFKTPHHVRLKRDYKVPIWQVAMATSAAPTFFQSFRKYQHLRFIDGGIWANNPTMLGIVEAIGILKVPLNNIHVFNLGTTDNVIKYRSILDKGGFLQWGPKIAELIIRSQSIGVYTQSKHLLREGNLIRLDPKVPDGLFKLDKITPEELISKAAHESRKYSPIFEDNFKKHIAPEYKPIYE